MLYFLALSILSQGAFVQKFHKEVLFSFLWARSFLLIYTSFLIFLRHLIVLRIIMTAYIVLLSTRARAYACPPPSPRLGLTEL